MKVVLTYGAIAAGLILGISIVLFILYQLPAERNAVVLSAIIALALQVPAFALLRGMRGAAFLNGWIIGAIGRMVVLVAYGFVILRSAALPMEPALVSLALFFVICTIIEPFFLQ
jgi:hypothetical protein